MRRRLPTLLLAALAALGPACGRGSARRIVLISIDTLRPDYLGCYGYGRPVSPRIDAVAKDARVFTQARSHVPVTLPSHCSMLTGMLPPFHSVRDNTGHTLGPEAVTVAELLKERGFRTHAVLGAYVLHHRFGLDQGFDSYDDGGMGDAGNPERTCEEVSRAATGWLEHHKDDDFFLFLHYYDPHLSYTPPEPYRTTLADSPYAGEVAYTDHCVGQVTDTLARLGLYDSTLVIVTSDHGEGLGEHTEIGHGYFIYDSTLRVPLVVRYPGGRNAARVDDPVALIDVAPTILAAAGIEPPPAMQGRDLAVAGAAEAPTYAESLLPTKFGVSPLFALVRGGLKYIAAPRPELYDLGADPGEMRDLAAEDTARAGELRKEIEEILARGTAAQTAGTAIDPAAAKSLESLGYLGGRTVAGGAGIEAGGEDAKDFAPFYNGFMQARELFARGDFRPARELIEQLVQARPTFDEAFNLLGRIDLAQGRTDDAVTHFARYLELLEAAGRAAEGAEARESLATLYMRRADGAAALPHLAKLVELRPEDASVHARLASLLAWRGGIDPALTHWRESIRLDPRRAEVRKELAQALVRTGDVKGAAEQWEEALRLEPWHVEARLSLGAALLVLGRAQEAANHLGEVIKAKPDMARGHRLFGVALYRLGRLREAEDRWNEALRYDPQDTATMEAHAWALATAADPSFRDPARARVLAGRARDLTQGKDPTVLRALAAALAASGSYAEAATVADQAIALLTAAGRTEESADLEHQRELYRAGKPYVETLAAAPAAAG